MKKVLFFILPFLLAAVTFFIFLFIQNKNLGRGALQVTANPKSKVYLNGQFIGETPICKCEGTDMIAVGKYSLKIVPGNAKLAPFENEIDINKSVLTVIDRTFGKTGTSFGSIITLEPLSNKNTSELLIVSLPDNASLYIDNNQSGKTPSLLKNITDSDHTIKLSKSGYQDNTIHIKTVKGYKLTAILSLGVYPSLQSETSTPSAILQVSPSAPISQVQIIQTPTGFLNVRNSPSLSGAVIAKVNPGDKFDLLSEKNGWFEIKLKNGGSGWISDSYAQKQ